jgi:hypothetical protein
MTQVPWISNIELWFQYKYISLKSYRRDITLPKWNSEIGDQKGQEIFQWLH